MNGMFVTDREGNELCLANATGAPGTCAEFCKNPRIHDCQHYLGQHPNSFCPKLADKKKQGQGRNRGEVTM